MSDKLAEVLEELLAAARDHAMRASKKVSEKETKEDISEEEKEGMEDKIEMLALQTFKILPKKEIEEFSKSESDIPKHLQTPSFLYFRSSILKRALEFYEVIGELPDLESFLKAGGCL